MQHFHDYSLWIRNLHGRVNRIRLFNSSKVWTWNYCWRWKICINFPIETRIKKGQIQRMSYTSISVSSCHVPACSVPGVEDKDWSEGETVQGFFWISRKRFDNKWINKIIDLIRQSKKSNISRKETQCPMSSWAPWICATRGGTWMDFPMAHCAEQILSVERSYAFQWAIPLFYYKKTALFPRDYAMTAPCCTCVGKGEVRQVVKSPEPSGSCPWAPLFPWTCWVYPAGKNVVQHRTSLKATLYIQHSPLPTQVNCCVDHQLLNVECCPGLDQCTT